MSMFRFLGGNSSKEKPQPKPKNPEKKDSPPRKPVEYNPAPTVIGHAPKDLKW